MRKIKMIGTAMALPPYRFGEAVFVEELIAYTLQRTGELQYADPRDTVSDAARDQMMQAISRQNRQRYADRVGVPQVLTASIKDKFYAEEPPPSTANDVVAIILPKVKPF